LWIKGFSGTVAGRPAPDRKEFGHMKTGRHSFAPTPADPGPSLQVGALCWRLRRGRVFVLLVTSRDTGRWIIPKGWQIAGLSTAEAAGREAWEEAGVTGQVDPAALGSFAYDKVITPDLSVPCRVNVHALRVAEVAHRFPERKARRRKWFSAGKAAGKVTEPELRSLLRRLADEGPALLAA
jgi:8-oxo-dGTP pyrophosphatase MutT (NUDIX family)